MVAIGGLGPVVLLLVSFGTYITALPDASVDGVEGYGPLKRDLDIGIRDLTNLEPRAKPLASGKRQGPRGKTPWGDPPPSPDGGPPPYPGPVPRPPTPPPENRVNKGRKNKKRHLYLQERARNSKPYKAGGVYGKTPWGDPPPSPDGGPPPYPGPVPRPPTPPPDNKVNKGQKNKKRHLYLQERARNSKPYKAGGVHGKTPWGDPPPSPDGGPPPYPGPVPRPPTPPPDNKVNKGRKNKKRHLQERARNSKPYKAGGVHGKTPWGDPPPSPDGGPPPYPGPVPRPPTPPPHH